jgi:hypothetical protein
MLGLNGEKVTEKGVNGFDEYVSIVYGDKGIGVEYVVTVEL